jgi:hypothetical protein
MSISWNIKEIIEEHRFMKAKIFLHLVHKPTYGRNKIN